MLSRTSLSTVKIALMGDSKTGKTTYARQYCTAEFYPQEEEGPSFSTVVNTTLGKVEFVFIDQEEKFFDADVFMIFFDVMNLSSYIGVDKYVWAIRKFCGYKPIVICANKTDIGNRIIQSNQIEIGKRLQIPVVEMSSMNYENWEEPMNLLLQHHFSQVRILDCEEECEEEMDVDF